MLRFWKPTSDLSYLTAGHFTRRYVAKTLSGLRKKHLLNSYLNFSSFLLFHSYLLLSFLKCAPPLTHFLESTRYSPITWNVFSFSFQRIFPFTFFCSSWQHFFSEFFIITSILFNLSQIFPSIYLRLCPSVQLIYPLLPRLLFHPPLHKWSLSLTFDQHLPLQFFFPTVFCRCLTLLCKEVKGSSVLIQLHPKLTLSSPKQLLALQLN